MATSDLELDARWTPGRGPEWELVIGLTNRGPKPLSGTEVRSGGLPGLNRPQRSDCPFQWIVADGDRADPGILVLVGALNEHERRECRLEFRPENALPSITLYASAPGNQDPTPTDAQLTLGPPLPADAVPVIGSHSLFLLLLSVLALGLRMQWRKRHEDHEPRYRIVPATADGRRLQGRVRPVRRRA